jgi:E1-E2 ATPase
MTQKPASLFDWNIVGPAIGDAFKKLNPRLMVKNPVMFVAMVGAAITTVGIFTAEPGLRGFVTQLAIWLWFTVLFANFAEAIAEGRGEEQVPAPILQKGNIVVCEAGDIIPADGDVIEGIASVDEAAITGESAPVIRESGGDRSAVTGGTRVLSDRIVIRVTMERGGGFLDRMIGLVEGADDFAGSIDVHFSARLCDAATVRNLFRHGLLRSGVNRAVSLFDSDDDRRFAQRHRHRGNGSRPSAQRACNERTRSRSSGRRRRLVTRQNWNDHARQSHGGRFSCRARCLAK